MDGRQFDLVAKALAVGGSRRQMIGRLAGSAAGGILGVRGVRATWAQTAGNAPLGQIATCREVGDLCGGDRLCCNGLSCLTSGKDGADRCIDENAPADPCAEGCPPTEGISVTRIYNYRITTDCAYDEVTDRSTCECVPQKGDNAPQVRRIALPQADICGEVVGGDFRVETGDVDISNQITNNSTNTASAGTGGEANAEASGGQVAVQGGGDDINIDASGGEASADASGGDNNRAVASGDVNVSNEVTTKVGIAGGRGIRYRSARPSGTLTLTLAGKIEGGKSATYWLETDEGLFPASGPALVPAPEEESPDAGVLIVRAASCPTRRARNDYDWFGQCALPVATRKLTVQLINGNQVTEVTTGDTDAGGRRSFRQLAPGTYRVAPEGANWCYAASDNVSQNGDIAIEAGARTTVWVFNCNGS